MGDSDNSLKMGNCNDNTQCFDIRGAAPSSTEVVNNIAPITDADRKARHISNRRGECIHPKNNPKPGKDDSIDKRLKLVGRHINKEVCCKLNSYNALLRMYEICYPDLRKEYLYEEQVLSKFVNNEDVSRVQQVEPPSSNSSKKTAESDKKKGAPREPSIPTARITRNSSKVADQQNLAEMERLKAALKEHETLKEARNFVIKCLDETEKEWTKKIGQMKEEVKSLTQSNTDLKAANEVKDIEIKELKIGAANEYLKGFNNALAQVRSLNPKMDLTHFGVRKIVSDGKLVDMPSSSGDGEDTPMVDVGAGQL